MGYDQRICVPSSIMAHKVSHSVSPCYFLLVADRMTMPWVTANVAHQKCTKAVSLISKKFYIAKPFCWLPVCLQPSGSLDFCIWEFLLLKLSLITIDLELHNRDKCVCASPVSQKHKWKRNVIKSLNWKIRNAVSSKLNWPS